MIYWRTTPLESLPIGPSKPISVETGLPPFPGLRNLELVGLVDASHASDIKTRRSVTGVHLMLAGAAVFYKSKLQTTVATSSTEAEFIAAGIAAKAVKYLRAIMEELGFAQDRPTKLYEDNQATILMVNENKPTPRARHIDIQAFAIQEWRARGILKMEYIPTEINSADQATKALPWKLHSRHSRRAMGHYGLF